MDQAVDGEANLVVAGAGAGSGAGMDRPSVEQALLPVPGDH
jgi:hypothetical protein